MRICGSETRSPGFWRPDRRRQRPLSRHPPLRRLGCQRCVSQGAHQSAQGPDARSDLARWVRAAGAAQPDLRGLALPSPADRTRRPRPRLPANHNHPQPCRRATRHRALQGQKGRNLCAVEAAASRRSRNPRTSWSSSAGSAMPIRRCSTSIRAETPPSSEEMAAAYRPYIETCIERSGRSAGCSKAIFRPMGSSSSYPMLWNAFKRPGLRRVGRREGRDVQRHGEAGVSAGVRRRGIFRPALLQRVPGRKACVATRTYWAAAMRQHYGGHEQCSEPRFCDPVLF